MNLKVYDAQIDEYRVATQDDVDTLTRHLRILSKMVTVLRHAVPDLVPASGPGFDVELDAALARYMARFGLPA